MDQEPKFPLPVLSYRRRYVLVPSAQTILFLHRRYRFYFPLQAIAYFVHLMEPVVNRDYVIVYFHTLSISDNQPDSSFFKQLYTMVDSR